MALLAVMRVAPPFFKKNTSTMPNPSKNKGMKFERALVAAFQEAGFGAEKTPLSGSLGGKYTGDLSVPLLGRDLCGEAKIRARGFRELYRWLAARDFLIVRADRSPPLVIISLKLAVEVMKAAEANKGANNE
jgi:hypothetical protein